MLEDEEIRLQTQTDLKNGFGAPLPDQHSSGRHSGILEIGSGDILSSGGCLIETMGLDGDLRVMSVSTGQKTPDPKSSRPNTSIDSLIRHGDEEFRDMATLILTQYPHLATELFLRENTDSFFHLRVYRDTIYISRKDDRRLSTLSDLAVTIAEIPQILRSRLDSFTYDRPLDKIPVHRLLMTRHEQYYVALRTTETPRITYTQTISHNPDYGGMSVNVECIYTLEGQLTGVKITGYTYSLRRPFEEGIYDDSYYNHNQRRNFELKYKLEKNTLKRETYNVNSALQRPDDLFKAPYEAQKGRNNRFSVTVSLFKHDLTFEIPATIEPYSLITDLFTEMPKK